MKLFNFAEEPKISWLPKQDIISASVKAAAADDIAIFLAIVKLCCIGRSINKTGRFAVTA